VVSLMSKRSRPARSSEACSDAEHKCRRKRYKWQKDNRASHYGRYNTRHNRGHWGVDSVHKPEPPADKSAGHDEAQETSGESDNGLEHIEFRV
jgi:hypothetical protein